MLKNKTNFTYLLMIIALLLSGCATVEAARGASSTLPITASSPETGSQASPTATSLLAQTNQKCSSQSLSQSIIATLGNGTGRRTSLVAIDPATGKQICGYNSIILGEDAAIRISPDHKYLAAIDFHSSSWNSSKIQIIDLTSWQAHEIRYAITDWVPVMVFSPDASHLALTFQLRGITPQHNYNYKLLMVDVRQSKVVAEAEVPFFPHFLQFTTDGKQIIAVGGRNYSFQTSEDSSKYDLNAQGIVVNADDMKSNLWEIPLQGIRDGSVWTMAGEQPSGTEYRSAVQLSPDGRSLYIVHAAENKLTQVDLMEKAVTTVNIQPKLSLIQQLLSLGVTPAYAKEINSTSKEAVISPDGKNMYVLSLTMSPDTQKGFSLVSHGLQVIATADGSEVARLNTTATRAVLSADGGQLYLRHELEKPWSETVSTTDFKTLAHFDGEFLMPVVGQDGKEVLFLGSQQRSGTKLTLLDPQTLQPIGGWLWKELNFNSSPYIWPEH